MRAGTDDRLPDDLVRFYTLCGGAQLFGGTYGIVIAPPVEVVQFDLNRIGRVYETDISGQAERSRLGNLVRRLDERRSEVLRFLDDFRLRSPWRRVVPCSCHSPFSGAGGNMWHRWAPNLAFMELGRIGIWSPQLVEAREGLQEAVAELDELGYSALWIPNVAAMDGPAMFERARELLDATRRIVVATGIASVWTHPAAEAAAAHRELTAAHPGRFLLGLGVSHEQIVDREQAGRYSRP